MLNSLKSFVFGGTAGSVAAPKTNTPANNSAVQPEMQRMMRTKRKRDSDGGEPLAKNAKVGSPEPTNLEPVSDVMIPTTKDVSISEKARRKRRRSSTSAPNNTPLKRMRRDEDDVMARPGVDNTQEPQHGELDDLWHESPMAPAPIDVSDEGAIAPENDAASCQSTEGTLSDEVDVVAGDLAPGLVNIVQQYRAADSGLLHGLLGSTSYKPSTRFRRQAKKYIKHVMADRNGHEAKEVDLDGEVESLHGIGSWPGSSNVPGSLRQEPHDAKDRIEMPPRKPRLVDWSKFEGRQRPSWVQRRRAACEAQLPPSQTAE